MKNKKVFALMLVLIMAISLMGACGGDKKEESKTVTDLVRGAAEKQFELKSQHSVVDVAFNLEIPDSLKTSPQFSMVSTLADAKLNLEQFSDIENEKGYLKAKLSGLQGMDFNFEAFILSGKELAVKSPMVPQIITLNVDDLVKVMEAQTPGSSASLKNTSFSGKVTEEQKELVKSAFDLYGEIFKDEKPSEAKEEIEFSTGKEEITVVTYSYKGDEVFAMIERIVKNALQGDKYVEMLKKAQKFTENQGSAQSMDIEKIIKEKDQMLKDFEENKEEFFKNAKENIEFNDITVKIGVDKDGFMRYGSFNIDISVISPELKGEKASLKFNIDSKIDKINAVKADEIQTVEINETNSISFDKLFNRGM